MFRWAADGLMSGVAGSNEMRNGLVEVLLLHERNLLDFFTSTGQGDDLTVRHFVPEWWPAEDPATVEAVTALKADRLSINKRLMHTSHGTLAGRWSFHAPGQADPHPPVAAMPGAAAASLDDLLSGPQPPPTALQPPWWDGAGYDLNETIAIVGDMLLDAAA